MPSKQSSSQNVEDQNEKKNIKKMLENMKREAKKQKIKDRQIKTQHDQLYREIRYGTECVKKHEKQWRKLLLSIAEPSMRMEVECAMHQFERCIDAKDFEISLLIDEVQAAEEQYARSVRSHIDDIDRIIVLCYDQIAQLWNDSASMISNLYRAATAERSEVVNVNHEHETYLKTMLYCLTENSKTVEKLMRGDNLSRQDVEITKLMEISAKYKEEMRTYFDNLWNEADKFMAKYRDDVLRRKQEVQDFDKSDLEMQHLVKNLWHKAQSNIETLKFLHTQKEIMEICQNKKIQELTSEKDHYDNIFKALKKKTKEEAQSDNNQLTILTLKCNEIIKFLEDCATKGTLLLRLGAVCRKFETLEEKTMRYPSYVLFSQKKSILPKTDVLSQTPSNTIKTGSNYLMLKPSEMLMKVDKQPAQSDDSSDTDTKVEEENRKSMYFKEMELFFYRVGALESTRMSILEECMKVRAENELLKKELFSYCQCLNCEQQVQFLHSNEEYF